MIGGGDPDDDFYNHHHHNLLGFWDPDEPDERPSDLLNPPEPSPD
jgi:hypothetical protein